MSVCSDLTWLKSNLFLNPPIIAVCPELWEHSPLPLSFKESEDKIWIYHYAVLQTPDWTKIERDGVLLISSKDSSKFKCKRLRLSCVSYAWPWNRFTCSDVTQFNRRKGESLPPRPHSQCVSFCSSAVRVNNNENFWERCITYTLVSIQETLVIVVQCFESHGEQTIPSWNWEN